MSKKIIVGNWKMNPMSLEEARVIFEGIESGIGRPKRATAVICPPFVYLAPLAAYPRRKVSLGAQDVFSESKGSFTGEVSPTMLRDLDVSYVIVGHSERRALGETDEIVNKKVLSALREKVVPIVCVGESTRDEEGQYLTFIKNQIQKALADVKKTELSSVVIAYEPIWAIGADAAMNARDIHETTLFIRKAIVDLFKLKTLSAMPILYGGSVDPTNAGMILKEGEIDGLLVGRQSLDPKAFLDIIKSA